MRLLEMGLITFSSCHFLLLVFFICGSRADLISDLEACKYANCGEGTCVPSNGTYLPYDCKCKPGWEKYKLVTTFPSCTAPACSIDFSCGYPPPPSSPILPPFNLSDPCTLAWCLDGTCIANETSYICKCNPKATNILNKSNLPCYRDCYFGADCKALGFGSGQASPLPSIPLPQPGNGQGGLPNSSGAQLSLTALLLFGMLLSFC